jgi:hypothetical protein
MLLVKQARAEGFLVFQFGHCYAEEGMLKYREAIEDGLENTPKAFIAMLIIQGVRPALVAFLERTEFLKTLLLTAIPIPVVA